jgi:FkbM family methyltransferase
MSNVFTHSGDIGDIIYSLPAIRAKGGGVLILFDSPGKTAHGMTEAKVNRLRPLLESQAYIESVQWSSKPIESSLNGFRDHMNQGNLADAHLATQGLNWSHRFHKWLSVEPNKKYRFLFSRSARYRNWAFPWQSIVYRYGSDAAFVGFEDEWKDFCNDFGYVRFAEQQGDFLELAKLIAGCEMFIGNQSSPLAVAHGLKHNLIMEISPGSSHPHCVFQRKNCIIGWDEKIELPEFEGVYPSFELDRDYVLWQEVYHGREYAIPLSMHGSPLVVDIGSHVGAFALGALHRGASHAICIEPSKTNIKHLHENLKGMSYSLIPKALHDNDGYALFNLAKPEEGTMMFLNDTGSDRIECVSWKTIQSMISHRNNVVVKCDAEGAEYFLVDEKNDLSNVGAMYVEAHDNTIINGKSYSTHDCIVSLSKHGFNAKITKNGPNTHIIEATR